MEKEFVPYDLAVKLKELGFDEPCFGWFNTNNNDSLSLCDLFGFLNELTNEDFHRNSIDDKVSTPTFSQAFRWFRENYKLSCSIELTDNSRHYFYYFTIYDSKNRDWNDEDCFDSCKRIYDDGKFGKHEEAELACLEKLIEIVEQKQKENTRSMNKLIESNKKFDEQYKPKKDDRDSYEGGIDSSMWSSTIQ